MEDDKVVLAMTIGIICGAVISVLILITWVGH